MGALKLIWAFLALANKLLAIFGKWNQRRQYRKEFQNEQIARQAENTRRAEAARRAVRRSRTKHPDSRLQDDGYRRD